MAALFGDERGPSTVTIRNGTARAAAPRHHAAPALGRLVPRDRRRGGAGDPPAAAQVELIRADRRVPVPFTVAPQRAGGWLVYAIDLNPVMPPTGPSSQPLVRQLEQDARRRLRVEERDPVAAGARAGRLVDQPVARRPAALAAPGRGRGRGSRDGGCRGRAGRGTCRSGWRDRPSSAARCRCRRPPGRRSWHRRRPRANGARTRARRGRRRRPPARLRTATPTWASRTSERWTSGGSTRTF